jgi:hypothetical protein
VGEYLCDKVSLYYAAEPNDNNRNYAYLRGSVLKGLYSSWVKTEVIWMDPGGEQALGEGCLRAVAQARVAYHLGAGQVANLDGLASTTVSSRFLQVYNKD